MRLIEKTHKYIANSENEAKDAIEQFRAQAAEKGYTIKKASFEYKTKKSKGEIIAEAWPVSIVMTFGELWEEE